jgi:hypothetical protein
MRSVPEAGSAAGAEWAAHRKYRGVYAVGHRNIPFEGEMLAAVKACRPGSWLSHFAGAAAWEFVEWDGRFPEVTVVGQGTRVHKGIRVHRTQRIEPVDVTRHRGIPITSPARTLLDLASVLRYQPLRRAVREAFAQRRVSHGQLTETITRLGPRGGSRILTMILADGPAPTRTVLEDVVLDLILDGGFAAPDVNVPIKIAGRQLVPDFRWPAERLIVEADGGQWHDHELARQDDAERQAFLEAHGERLIRVTWKQALSERAQTRARIDAAGAPKHRPST